jgi:hypothetical protein
MAFKAPNNYLDFYKEMVRKSEKLIEIGYWDKIENRKLSEWLQNFETDEEKYLAALILHKLVYRNDKTIDSMLNKLFNITIPNLLERYSIYSINMTMNEWREKLRNPGFKEVGSFLFSTIISDELGDSGNDYMRRLREKFVIKELICKVTDNKRNHHKGLIFIDDIIASGTQICEFLHNYKNSLSQYDYLIFTPLIAHKHGIDKIEKCFESLQYNNYLIIQPLEVITCDNNILDFKIQNDGYFDGVNTIEDLENFYISIVDLKNLKQRNEGKFGFGDLGLALIFSTGIPDNTIPLIRNKNKDSSWKPLYEKF